MMKLMSWNINGIRAACRNGIPEVLEKENCDAVMLQEVKAQKSQIPDDLLNMKYNIHVNSAERKGYSGTMAMVKKESVKITEGTGHSIADSEGRVQTLEYPEFYLVNCYFPNSQRELTRLDLKIEFDRMIHSYCNRLRKEKPVVICGDFNVAHTELDIARPDENRNNAGFTDREREWMDEFLNDSYVDTFRMFHTGNGNYSWWSYRAGVREKNIGWRIDYFIVSSELESSVRDAYILSHIRGSDHAPVILELDL